MMTVRCDVFAVTFSDITTVITAMSNNDNYDNDKHNNDNNRNLNTIIFELTLSAITVIVTYTICHTRRR